MKREGFNVKYEYVPSKQSEIRLQRAFEIIFEKILNTQIPNKHEDEYEHENN